VTQVVVVETEFDPPLSDEEHSKIGKRLDSCLELRSARWMRSYLSSDRKRMVCEFEAADAQSVRDAYRAAAVAFERVWLAELYSRG
jgi:Protein of unknown function (DUF4242)